jgi:hypothetical protein
MNQTGLWSRVLGIAGFVAMLVGAIDPLEGSVVILAGVGLAALGARLGMSRHRKLLYWAFGLALVGVGAVWGLSVVGGIGGNTGRSIWWALVIAALVIAPYPVGWILGIIGGLKRLRESWTAQAK